MTTINLAGEERCKSAFCGPDDVSLNESVTGALSLPVKMGVFPHSGEFALPRRGATSRKKDGCSEFRAGMARASDFQKIVLAGKGEQQMARAIEILMNEHRVIERVLGSLETFVVKMDKGIEGERAFLADYVNFLHNFADKCHHGKEEDILFERMLSYGFPAEVGPLAVMRREHALGREHLSALASITQGSSPLSRRERETVRNHALAYIDLLGTHILKENNLLYPMALAAIPRSEMETLAAEFDGFEEREMSPGRHETLHALADRLAAAFPPAPANVSPGAV